MSFSEAAMWNLLRRPPLRKWHFRRQVEIGPYYADFASHAIRLVVEVDGAHHTTDSAVTYDSRRTALMESHGYRVVRFWAPDVLRQQASIFEMLLAECSMDVSASGSPHPPPVGGPPSP
jgi:very-short-patch-repair endonuclease